MAWVKYYILSTCGSSIGYSGCLASYVCAVTRSSYKLTKPLPEWRGLVLHVQQHVEFWRSIDNLLCTEKSLVILLWNFHFSCVVLMKQHELWEMSSFNCGSKYPICTHTKIGILRTFKKPRAKVYLLVNKREI